ncbi:MAG: family 78 glycoside hydrolase catalytic domain [Bacteroidales bacterium]|nr:family 78 glycoside hydrolase catalytic domain [Bacteroidales bacterium]
MKKILFLAFALLAFLQLPAEPAKYVWDTPTGEGRQQYVYFRNEVELSELPAKAELNLYAYSRYSLTVNGEYINFGPVRSTQKYPYYDTYDLLPHLKTGKNVIAVKAMNNGMETFQIPFGSAAFIAWGEIDEKGKKIDLSTPGNWLCRAAQGYAQNSQRYSFAKGPIECFDARLEPDDWQGYEITAKEWKRPTVLKDQSKFGKLAPRSIPMLTQSIIQPKECLQLCKRDYFGTLYNFQVLGNDLFHSSYGNANSVQAYTYIYSPTDQDITARFSWGNIWLNGDSLLQTDTNVPFQHQSTLALNKGWNLLFADLQIVFGGTEFMMVLPDDKGLMVSADKGKDEKKGFAISGPNEIKTVSDPASFVPEGKNKKWAFVPSQNTMVNPAKAVSWMRERRMVAPDPIKQNDFIFSPDEYNSTLFDMGGKQLARVFVDVIAPEGAIIDVTFSEDLENDNAHLYRMYTVNSGVRFISKGGRQHFESFKPYGLRYLQVTVSENSSPVTLENVGVIRQVYPFEKKGSFSCSDPLLNSIWELGWRTLQVCSEDTYTDTPFRERGHYAGDMYPEYAISLATSGDSRLAKQSIRMFLHTGENVYLGNGEQLGNDFSAITLLVASWVIRMTDDQAFAEEIYPYLKNYLQVWYNHRTPQGYYQPKDDTFFEWVDIDKKAALTQFQTLIYALNREMAGIAKRLGDTEQIAIANQRADELKETINTLFWGGEANGVFLDGIKNGRYLTTKFPNSSAVPMAYGVTDSIQDHAIMRYLNHALIHIMSPQNNKQLVTSYGGFYALAGLYAKENAATAEKFMRKHWAPMIFDGDDTAWEDFDRNNTSWTLSHAWSGAPTYYLSTQALGVQLGFPGAFSPDTITIAPQSETLSWAKGTVPHPKGMVSVSWRVGGNNLYLDYSAPKGVPVKIEPRGRLAGYNLILKNLSE